MAYCDNYLINSYFKITLKRKNYTTINVLIKKNNSNTYKIHDGNW